MTTDDLPPASAHAAENLPEAIYAELRRMASALMAGERRGHTLAPTALAHEVWLKLLTHRTHGPTADHAWLALAGKAMRRILTDHARRRAAGKRGHGAHHTTLAAVTARSCPSFLALDLEQAMTALEAIDAELARVVELRFYAGCTVEETASAMHTTPRTVKRRWRLARAWLLQHMTEDHE